MLQALDHIARFGELDFQVYMICLISSLKAEVLSINLSKNEIDISSFE